MRAYLLIAFAAVIAMLGAALYGLTELGRGEPPARMIEASIGPTGLKFSSAYLRPDSRDGGAKDRLDLAALYPSFAPPSASLGAPDPARLDQRFETTIFISIAAAGGDLDPAERPGRLYARFLSPNSWSHPGGLVARAFEAGSPFESEELFYVEPEGREFAARCPKPDQARKTPTTCIAQYRKDGLDVEIIFSAQLLSEWQGINAGVRGLIERARR